MFTSDQELHLERHHLRQNDLRREVDHARLVREARQAARDERQQSGEANQRSVTLVTRLFSLFF